MTANTLQTAAESVKVTRLLQVELNENERTRDASESAEQNADTHRDSKLLLIRSDELLLNVHE